MSFNTNLYPVRSHDLKCALLFIFQATACGTLLAWNSLFSILLLATMSPCNNPIWRSLSSAPCMGSPDPCLFTLHCNSLFIVLLPRCIASACTAASIWKATEWVKVADIEIYIQLVSVQFSSVAQSCLTLCDPMNRSTPGLPVHHQLPEFTQTGLEEFNDNCHWNS